MVCLRPCEDRSYLIKFTFLFQFWCCLAYQGTAFWRGGSTMGLSHIACWNGVNNIEVGAVLLKVSDETQRLHAIWTCALLQLNNSYVVFIQSSTY